MTGRQAQMMPTKTSGRLSESEGVSGFGVG